MEGVLMDGAGKFVLYFLAALFMSVLCWIVCTRYTKLWNKEFSVSPSFHFVCALAAIITFFTTLIFIGLKNTRPVAESLVQQWSEELVSDSELSNESFREAFYAIKDAGKENIKNYKTPENGGTLIPMSYPETYELVGRIYADAACRDFNDRFPFLGYFLHADSGIPTEVVAEDVARFFANDRSKTYPLQHGMTLAIQHIGEDLQMQTGRIVRITRRWLLILFLLVQAVPFGIIGYLAYKDLHFGHHDIMSDYEDEFSNI